MDKKFAQNVGNVPSSETATTGGKQRYFCKNCKKHLVISTRTWTTPKQLYQDYVKGKQTLRHDKVNQILNLFGSEVGVVPMIERLY